MAAKMEKLDKGKLTKIMQGACLLGAGGGGGLKMAGEILKNILDFSAKFWIVVFADANS